MRKAKRVCLILCLALLTAAPSCEAAAANDEKLTYAEFQNSGYTVKFLVDTEDLKHEAFKAGCDKLIAEVEKGALGCSAEVELNLKRRGESYTTINVAVQQFPDDWKLRNELPQGRTKPLVFSDETRDNEATLLAKFILADLKNCR